MSGSCKCCPISVKRNLASISAIAERPSCRVGQFWPKYKWKTRYSAPNVVSARKLKALIFYMINPLLYKNRHFCVFEPPLGSLGSTYDVHLRLIGEPIVDFLLVIIELFSLGVMVEAL